MNDYLRVFAWLVPLAALTTHCFYEPDRSKISSTTSGTDTVNDAAPDDDGGAECDDVPLPAGIGEPCLSDRDCPCYGANFCLKYFLDPEQEGICTIKDCTFGNCPVGFVCCDCSNSQQLLPQFRVIACVLEQGAEELMSICSCE
ncbi:MAG: hypothetical protein QNJ97_01425 [Myxococcota bacterium]|nr:hypothetical protein [Myxococcota bacterium]